MHEDGGRGQVARAAGARGAPLRAGGAFDVGRLADRRAAEVKEAVREFFARDGAFPGRRLAFSEAESAALWGGWRCEDSDGPLGEALLAIERRLPRRLRRATAVPSEEQKKREKEESEEMGRKFRAFAGPSVRFECSMLQTALEGADGLVTWRDVKCEDEDDFDALWSRQWQLADSVVEDEELWLPVVKPSVWVGPSSMLESWGMGVKDGRRGGRTLSL